MNNSPIFLSKPGIFCAAGESIQALWDSVVNGNQDGIKKVVAISGEEFFAARIDDNKIKNSSGRFDMRIIRIEEQALNQISDIIEITKSKYGVDRIGVCVGSCDNGTEFSLAGHREYFADGVFNNDYSIEMQGADYVATFISEKYGITGPSCAFSTACSSSAGAIIKAAEMIKAGFVDAVIAGGVDIASDTTLLGFNSLGAISDEKTNPFSQNRHGITLGEGAAFFVLTKEFLSENENEIKLLGWGESADAYHMTSPDPSGKGAESSMKKALDMSFLHPSDIDYINMHGTGTKFNDSMEAKAINIVFGDNKVPVSTTKAITGHTLGASASLELAICYEALVKNKGKNNNIELPLQVWDGEQDANLPELNIIDGRNKSIKKEIKTCLSNSFAFGGANASLVIGF
ncbi:MAG: 3-oxoacyl-ACP synthase [Treponema sp.]|jgi:3-oxoacyl-[acyl-carrier-protein] synthase I|nr:3-oxoacyl-ACP synthase [Treponema sp.]